MNDGNSLYQRWKIFASLCVKIKIELNSMYVYLSLTNPTAN
jgi:hypothetical protein